MSVDRVQTNILCVEFQIRVPTILVIWESHLFFILITLSTKSVSSYPTFIKKEYVQELCCKVQVKSPATYGEPLPATRPKINGFSTLLLSHLGHYHNAIVFFNEVSKFAEKTWFLFRKTGANIAWISFHEKTLILFIVSPTYWSNQAGLVCYAYLTKLPLSWGICPPRNQLLPRLEYPHF